MTFYWFVSVCLPVPRLSVRPSVRPSVGLSVCLSVCLSVSLSVCLSICLSLCLSVCLSVYAPACISCSCLCSCSCSCHLVYRGWQLACSLICTDTAQTGFLLLHASATVVFCSKHECRLCTVRRSASELEWAQPADALSCRDMQIRLEANIDVAGSF